MTREEREAKRFRDRDAQQAHRKWYFTARWKKLRQEIKMLITNAAAIDAFELDKSYFVDFTLADT